MGSIAATWSSKKQEIAALSTTEVEYIVVTSSAYQVAWLRRLLSNIGQEQILQLRFIMKISLQLQSLKT